MNILDEIAKKYGTDKSSERHGYCDKYEKYLPFKRDDKLKILEIGVASGNSLKMWKEYFYNSEILGIDIDPNAIQCVEDRISIQIGSQSDYKFLSYLSDDHGPFDLIIDDGSHINSDVIISFKTLFTALNSGGVYIIEDTCTSYWGEYNGGYKKNGSMIEYFKDFIDYINFLGEYNKNIDIDDPYSRNDKQLVKQFENSRIYNFGLEMESIIFLNSLVIINKR